MKKKTATVEILEKGELVLGSPTRGEYMVRRFEDGLEMSGEFFYTIVEAGKAVREWEGAE
jgi:hypothetical protein|tara:strand:+ start:360 stop:539 length:180 start_codon:yes stop_codon:yes gene_type:complete